MNALLNTDDLAVGYTGRVLLRNVSVRLHPGRVTALLGVNGSGKSTLLRTLAGLRLPIGGHIQVLGRELGSMHATERARSVAFVSAGRPHNPFLRMEELVALGRIPWSGSWGKEDPKDCEAIEAAMERCGILALRDRSIAQCSDGECQKAVIARCLAQDAPLLFLDEPTAFLDLPNRAAIVRLLGDVARTRSRAVLFSTHDVQLAMDLCDDLWLVRSDGGLIHGPAGEVVRSGELERAFAGTGIGFNLATGTHRFLR